MQLGSTLDIRVLGNAMLNLIWDNKSGLKKADIKQGE
jgi:hypothetical protein